MIDIFGWVMAVANVILICLIYAQYREQKKPIITTKIINLDKKRTYGLDAEPSTFVGHPTYLVIRNISNNLASNIEINYKFLLDNVKLTEISKKLDYLNPNEATHMIVGLRDIIEKRPDLFDKIEDPNLEGFIKHVIPKKSMYLLLNIYISCNPVLGKFLPYEIKDSYEIWWCSLEHSPSLEDRPVVDCWNKRNGLYIKKIESRELKR